MHLRMCFTHASVRSGSPSLLRATMQCTARRQAMLCAVGFGGEFGFSFSHILTVMQSAK